MTMLARMLLRVLAYGLSASLVAGAGYYVLSGAFSEQFAATLRENAGRASNRGSDAASERHQRENRGSERKSKDDGPSVPDAVGNVAATAWNVVSTAALVGLLLGGTIVVRRIHRRRTYRCHAWHIVPYEGEMGSTGSITDTWEQIHQALAARWWRRVWGGQPPITVGLVSERVEETGALRYVVFALTPRDRAVEETIEAALRGTYENVRLEPFALHARLDHVVRLKRDLPFWRGRLPTPVISADAEDEQREFMVDRLLTTMEQMQESSIVAMTMWPTPALFERVAQRMLRRQEAAALDEVGGADAGSRSAVLREELEGAAEGLAHRPLFFGEIRVAAAERRVVEQLATVIQGSSRRGEGRLVRLHVGLRRRLYQLRMARGLGNPIPSWSHAVYSTAELAALWRLPKSFRSAGRIQAHPMPRLLPPPGMRRVPAEKGIVLAERGVERGVQRGLALWPGDLRANMGILGTIEAGKTTALVRAGLNLAADENRMLVFIDPKGDGWKRLLAALETDRPVYVIDCAAPELGFSPLVGSLDTQKKVAAVLEALREMYRVDGQNAQMYARSLAAFQIFAEAAIELLPDPRYDDLADFLSVTEEGYAAREWLMGKIASTGRAIHLLDEVRELEAQLDDAKSAFTQQLASPRNKITRLRMEPMISVLHHPAQLDLKRAMEERAIVVVNGGQGVLDMEHMHGLLTMLLVMVSSTVLSQQELPEDERADVTLILDEAHFFLGNEYFKAALATARSAGLSSLLAFQTLAQLARDDQLRGLTSLVRNWLFFRISPDDARDVTNLLQQVHFDGVGANDDTLDRLAANPRALAAARQFWAVGSWVVRGDPSPAFTCQVEPVPTVAERIDVYRHDQRSRVGAHPLEPGEHRPPHRPWHPDAKAHHPTADEEVETSGSATPEDARTPARSNGDPEQESAPAQRSEARQRPGRQAATKSTAASAPAASHPSGHPARANEQPSVSTEPSGAASQGVESPARHPIPAELDKVPSEMTLLDRYQEPTGIRWEEPRPAPSPRPVRGGRGKWGIVQGTRQPHAKQMEVLRGLYTFGVMTQFQIDQRYFGSGRSGRRAMQELVELGLVQVLVVTTRAKGRDPKMYRLTRAGFELGKLTSGQEGNYIPRGAEWEEDDEVAVRKPGDPSAQVTYDGRRKRSAVNMAHTIETVSWAIAFEDLAGPCIRATLGEHQCYALPPLQGPIPKRGGASKPPPKRPHQIKGTGKHNFTGLDFDFGKVRPDIGFELEVDASDKLLCFDLLVEYERTPARNDRLRDKLRHYDALITCWHREHRRYSTMGPPIVLFVCPTWEQANRYAEFADAVLQGAVGRDGDQRHELEYTGRNRCFFTAVRLTYQRSLLAFKVPDVPPGERARGARNRRERTARQEPQAGPVVEMLPARVLERPLRVPR